jgi:hypothetical protein
MSRLQTVGRMKQHSVPAIVFNIHSRPDASAYMVEEGSAEPRRCILSCGFAISPLFRSNASTPRKARILLGVFGKELDRLF